MSRRLLSLLLATTLTLAMPGVPGPAAGAIYLCTDSSGIPLYTNSPQRAADCQKVREESAAADARPSPAAAENAPPGPSAYPPPGSAGGRLHGAGLAGFFTRLQQLQTGERKQVTVLHVGDSHVRADSFARTIATGLESDFGALGGAFCYPLEAVKKTKKKTQQKSSATSRPAAKAKTPRRTIIPSRPLSSTPLGADSKCFTITALPDSPDGAGVRYYSYGAIGKTFAWYARQAALATLLEKSRPDIVIVTLGTNDAFARLDYGSAWRDIDHFVSAVRSVAPDCAILFTTPPDSFFRDGTGNPYIATQQQAILAYTDRHGLAAWDFYAAMGGSGSMDAWLAADLAHSDRIHLNYDGYALKGEMLLQALRDGYRRFLAGADRAAEGEDQVSAVSR